MKMAQKYLIAVDMDGTLLNSQGKITEKSVGILQRLLDAGHYVVPASGRSLTLLPKEINALCGLKFGVLGNGAVVWDYEKKASVYKRLLPEGAAEQILAEVKKWYEAETKMAEKTFHYYTEVIADGVVYTEKKDRKWYHAATIGGNFVEYMLANHEYVSDIHEQKDLLQRAEKINLYFEDTAFAAGVRERWNDVPGICVTTSVNGNAEFMAAGVNKGAGVARLKEILGMDTAQVIAIGDNVNDVEMFAQAGISAAMGNAADGVKQKASCVVGDNDHDGAAVFLEHLLLES